MEQFIPLIKVFCALVASQLALQVSLAQVAMTSAPAGATTNPVNLIEAIHPPLVEATVTSIAKDPASPDLWIVITARVTHVYFGPASLEGKTFTAGAKPGGNDSNGSAVSPVPNVGEGGTWAVRQSDGRRWGHTMPIPDLELQWPRLARDAKGYAEGRAIARAIERIGRAAPAEQTLLVRALALGDPTPAVRRLAIALAGQTTAAWARDTLEAVERDDRAHPQRMTSGARLVLDRGLVAQGGPAYAASGDRIALLRRVLAHAGEDPGGAASLEDGVLGAIETGLPEAAWLALVREAIADPRAVDPARLPVYLREVVRLSNDSQAAFDTLVTLVRESRLPAVRCGAAAALADCDLAKDARRQRVLDLRATTTEPAVVERLLDALTERPAKDRLLINCPIRCDDVVVCARVL